MKQLLDPSTARAAAYVALYPMLQQIAKRYGYALAVHGSLHRDFDLVAIPWIDEAGDPMKLMRAIKRATRTVITCEGFDHIGDWKPTEKPHGRMAFSLHVTNQGMYGGYLDISIMPKIETATHKPLT